MESRCFNMSRTRKIRSSDSEQPDHKQRQRPARRERTGSPYSPSRSGPRSFWCTSPRWRPVSFGMTMTMSRKTRRCERRRTEANLVRPAGHAAILPFGLHDLLGRISSLGIASGRLSSRQCGPACDERRAGLADLTPPLGAGGVAGRTCVRAASGPCRVGFVDQRTQERAVGTLLPAGLAAH